jgi:hypothetical protein
MANQFYKFKSFVGWAPSVFTTCHVQIVLAEVIDEQLGSI